MFGCKHALLRSLSGITKVILQPTKVSLGLVFQKINRGLKHGYFIANVRISLLQNTVKYVESISQRASIVGIKKDWPSLDIPVVVNDDSPVPKNPRKDFQRRGKNEV